MSKGRNAVNLRALAPGMTWVFQGTVAEDATAGTHVCTLTVTPGAGNEMLLEYGKITNGNTATQQIMSVTINDGANALATILNRSDTGALIERSFPTLTNTTSNANQEATGDYHFPISGTMALVLKVSTAAVSVTQTFAVVCRIYGNLPTATLNDTIGTSTNTINTNEVF